jgi:hypothetical protein
VPCSTIRPAFITTMTSALRTVDSRWAMMKLVRPERSRAIASWIRTSVRVSMLVEQCPPADDISVMRGYDTVPRSTHYPQIVRLVSVVEQPGLAVGDQGGERGQREGQGGGGAVNDDQAS